MILRKVFYGAGVIYLTALFVVGTMAPAHAGCPPGTSYSCVPTMNGKMMCGCH